MAFDLNLRSVEELRVQVYGAEGPGRSVADEAAARCHFFFAHRPPLQIQHVGQNVPAKRNGPIRARAHSNETPPPFVGEIS